MITANNVITNTDTTNINKTLTNNPGIYIF